MFQENSIKRGSGAQESHQIQSSGNTLARSSTVLSPPPSSSLFCVCVCVEDAADSSFTLFNKDPLVCLVTGLNKCISP